MQGTAAECFPMEKCLLCWPTFQLAVVAREAAGNFTVQDDDVVFDPGGAPHGRRRDEQITRTLRQRAIAAANRAIALECKRFRIGCFAAPRIT